MDPAATPVSNCSDAQPAPIHQRWINAPLVFVYHTCAIWAGPATAVAIDPAAIPVSNCSEPHPVPVHQRWINTPFVVVYQTCGFALTTAVAGWPTTPVANCSE